MNVEGLKAFQVRHSLNSLYIGHKSWSLAGETVDQVSTGPNNDAVASKGIVLVDIPDVQGV